MKKIKEFAEELADAYSTDAYRNGWGGCIRMLRRHGYSDNNIEAIIRSKWTRWAGDHSDKTYGQYTSTDLEKFLNNSNTTKKEVDDLTLESGLEIQ